MSSSSLRYRFFGIVLGIFALSAALAWYAFDRSVGDITRELGVRFAERQVQFERERIRGPLLREIALTTRLAHSQTLLAWLGNEDDAALKQAGLAELEGFRGDFQDHSVFLIDDTSLHYYFNDRDNHFGTQPLRYTLVLGNARDDWYFRLRHSTVPYEINVDYDFTLNVTKVWINMPVRRDGRMIGVVGTGLDLSEFIQRFVQTSARGVSNVIVNSSGAIQAHQQAQLIALDSGAFGAAKGTASSIFSLLDSDAERDRLASAMRAAARDPQSVSTLFVRQQRHNRLLGVAYLPEMDWYLVTEMDLGQLIGAAPFRAILIVIAIALLASLLLVAWALERLVLRRVARLDIAAQRIAGGDYALRLEDPRNDEIGRLTGNFDRMASTVHDTLTNLEARVDERTHALSEANAALARQREETLASLRYARSIQSAILPSDEMLDRLLGPHLLLWLPRDHVSGDFYFAFQAYDGLYAGVADCTGHGVPGALTSLVGFNIVRRAVLSSRATGHRPLEQMVERIDDALRDMVRADGVRDAPDHGMALGMVRINRVGAGNDPTDGGRVDSPGNTARLVEFCGRGIDMMCLRSAAMPGAANQLERLPGSRGGLGYRIRRRRVEHLCHTLHLDAADRLYLASDGLYDHAGGADGFGFGRERFEAVLRATCTASLADQQQALIDAIVAHGGLASLRDDLTVLGFALGAGDGISGRLADE